MFNRVTLDLGGIPGEEKSSEELLAEVLRGDSLPDYFEMMHAAARGEVEDPAWPSQKAVGARRLGPVEGRQLGVLHQVLVGQVRPHHRLAQKVALEEDNQNFILMHALGANTAGQAASVIAAGVLMALVFPTLGT